MRKSASVLRALVAIAVVASFLCVVFYVVFLEQKAEYRALLFGALVMIVQQIVLHYFPVRQRAQDDDEEDRNG